MTAGLRIAVDFDNTVVDHRLGFHAAAVEEGLLPPGPPLPKTAVRQTLRDRGMEEAWTALQGHVYGPGMERAPVYPGVGDFFERCRRSGVPVAIISHRTKVPFLGEAHDLHAAARAWLERNGFRGEAISLGESYVYFEVTAEEKVARIRHWGATHAIDDLPEFLTRDDWPPSVVPLLFDPHEAHVDADLLRVRSWAEATATLLDG